MKKLLFLSLLSALLLTLSACNRGGNGNQSDGEQPARPGITNPTPTAAPTPAPTPPPVPPGSREYILSNIPDGEATGYVVMVAPIRPDANMLAGWTNPTTNNHARLLMFGSSLSGLSTMSRNHFNDVFPNPIVMKDGAWPVVTDNPDGSRTYRFMIYTDNRFSDGSVITAHHYAGSIAFVTSPQWAALVPSAGDWLEVTGRGSWINGESGILSGVRIYSDSEFSLTIDAEHLPNVWEAAMFMGVGPTALHAYGVEAHDDGNGVFLTGPGRIPLTFEALNLAVNGGTFEYQIDEETGEYALDAVGERIIIGGDGQRYRPTVFSGPYMFESVDVGNSVLTLVVNPYFPGTWDGFKPRIERIIWRFVPVPLIVDALAAGEVHMNVAMAGGENLQNAFATLINIDNPSHTFFNYPQHGQSLIQFHTDFGPTQFREVRQAMSYLIDRYAWNEIVNRGFATVPHGPYGAAWWWYQEAMERGLRDRLVIYGLNISRAIELLESGGWNYTATGEPFIGPGNENHIRHKWVDGELMPLEIRWVVTPDPSVGRDTLNLQLPENMAYAGMRLVEERSQRWAAIMQGGYREEERFHMYQLTVGMATIWAPWLLFSLEWIPQSNWGQVDNPVTRELADRFRVLDITTPEGHSAFVDAFIDFMVHLNYEAYTIPMSMSLHHDFIPTWLGGWFNTGLWTFPEAIQRSYIRG